MAELMPPLQPSTDGRAGACRDRGRPWTWWHVLALALAGGFAVLLFFHRPQGQIYFPRCTFYTSTGLLCPGCGGLRASHELLHGHWLAAARCNALLVLGLPAAGAWWLRQRLRSRSAEPTSRMIWILFGVAVVFTVLRNIGWGPLVWLAPPVGS